MALDDDMAGGASGYYNPSFGLMAIQNPEMFVQHLARNGVEPPEDFPENFSHQDAHQVLGKSLKDPSRLPSSDGLQNPPPTQDQPTNFEDRFKASFGSHPVAQPSQGADPMKFLPEGRFPIEFYTGAKRPQEDLAKVLGPDEQPSPKKAPSPDMPLPKPPPAPTVNPIKVGTEPWGGRPHVDPEPLPPGDSPSTAGGSAVPAGGTKEQTGDLNKQEPTEETNLETKKKTGKSDSIDSFGKALAGISALKTPTPVFPHPSQIPHPGSQISRSTIPTELLKELATIGQPGTQVRLGSLLKGR